MEDRGYGISHGILRIIYEPYSIEIRKVLELFLEISYHDADIGYACLPKLPYLSFDHGFSEYGKQPLRGLIGEGHETGAEACGKDHGLFHPEGRKIAEPGIGEP